MYILQPKCVITLSPPRSFRDEVSRATALGLVSEDAAWTIRTHVNPERS